MDDAVRVREGDGLADAQEHAEPLAEIPPPGHPAIEPIAAHELHRVEEAAVRQLAEVVDGDDAGVLEAGDEPRLVRLTWRAVEDLQRHLAVERRVACEVDDAHPAAAEDGDQLVPRAGDIRAAEHRGQAVDRRLGIMRGAVHRAPAIRRRTPRRSRIARAAPRGRSGGTPAAPRRARSSRRSSTGRDAAPDRRRSGARGSSPARSYCSNTVKRSTRPRAAQASRRRAAATANRPRSHSRWK